MAASFQASQRFTKISSRPSPNFFDEKKNATRVYEFPFKLSLETGKSSDPMGNFFFYVIWSRFVASIPELRRLGLTKTSWLYPFKPAKGLQGFHPDLLQFFWWDKKVPLESMSFLSNWVLKQACLQFPWTFFLSLRFHQVSFTKENI